MRARAVAVPSERSTAVGALEVECTPEGLRFTYLAVGAYQPGYAPAAYTGGTATLVPWHAVAIAVEGERVRVEVEPALTPHHRLLLDRFSSGEVPGPRAAHQRRLVVAAGSGATAVLVALVAVLGAPRVAPGVAGLTVAAVAALGAGAVLGLGYAGERLLGPLSEGAAAREAFLAEVARWLPGLTRGPEPEPPPAPFAWPTFERWLPRTAAGIGIALAALGVALLLGTRAVTQPPDAAALARAAAASRFSRDGLPGVPQPGRGSAMEEQGVAAPGALTAEGTAAAEDEPGFPGASPRSAAASPSGDAIAANGRSAPSPAPTDGAAASGAGGTAAASGAEVATVVATTGAPCVCTRAASLLWASPLPRLAVLVFDEKPVVGSFRPRTTAEVAVVNASREPMTNIALRVDFHDEPPVPGRPPTSSRAVYFAGPLLPGGAVKWAVRSRGRHLTVDAGAVQPLAADGSDAAPADALAELLRANHRPVRLYGALMLAWLGDPRAAEATRELADAQRDAEQPWLARVGYSARPLRVCELVVSGAGGAVAPGAPTEPGSTGAERRVSACLFNAGRELAEGVAAEVRGVTALPSLLAPERFSPTTAVEVRVGVPGRLAPGTGVRFEAALPGAAALVWEARADRADLL